MTNLTPFHLAIPVHNLAVANTFYGETLGLPRGRFSDEWTDYNLFGHQLVVHETGARQALIGNEVDGHSVPVPHFGVVLTLPDWYSWRDHLVAQKIQFVIAPYVRFAGEPGEQATMFFQDPSGNALEFKAFADIESSLFAVDR